MAWVPTVADGIAPHCAADVAVCIALMASTVTVEATSLAVDAMVLCPELAVVTSLAADAMVPCPALAAVTSRAAAEAALCPALAVATSLAAAVVFLCPAHAVRCLAREAVEAEISLAEAALAQRWAVRPAVAEA